MEELPNTSLSVVWNRLKTIPPTSTYSITIVIETSVEIESIKQWLNETIGGSFQNISHQTSAKEALISIETTKL